MKRCGGVFSDIDGTFLDSEHKVLPRTIEAIERLKEQGIPFALVSARSPGEIYPILEQYGLRCPFIACSGGLILDENRQVLWEQGMEQQEAGEIIRWAEERQLPLAWCAYSLDQWIVKDRKDPRIRKEEEIVGICAREGSISSLPEGDRIYKLMCICDPETTLEIEEKLTERFPGHSIAKSSPILIEIMAGGIHKARAVEWLCRFWGISPRETLAFGDNYNDLEMLQLCRGAAMGNAPEEIRQKAEYVTADHDHDGIYRLLKELSII